MNDLMNARKTAKSSDPDLAAHGAELVSAIEKAIHDGDTFEDGRPHGFTTTAQGELEQAAYFGGEIYAELKAEHDSETAAFGDSWPGAQIQVAAAFKAMQGANDDLIAYSEQADAELAMAVAS
ncbi:MAG: hypothetical protein DRH30_07875 [Deltaproteobacteria bacterium]|nr:MAG: hypothetical protein DRH30_07875 [Deltaproteobacteria bacterium]